MTDEIQFLVFLEVFASLALIREALLGELSDLNLVVLSIEDLSLEIFDFDAVRLDLGGEPLDLNGLEDNHELEVTC